MADPALADRPVAAIGARWGFTSPADFSRAFRAAHAMTPAECRESARNAKGPARTRNDGAGVRDDAGLHGRQTHRPAVLRAAREDGSDDETQAFGGDVLADRRRPRGVGGRRGGAGRSRGVSWPIGVQSPQHRRLRARQPSPGDPGRERQLPGPGRLPRGRDRVRPSDHGSPGARPVLDHAGVRPAGDHRSGERPRIHATGSRRRDRDLARVDPDLDPRVRRHERTRRQHVRLVDQRPSDRQGRRRRDQGNR
ncbi:hypothetical protein [Actinocorallia longicatena]|uniref:hypothetical protein n=1 Tax=Actinocorallia longicatena TaxID=111803 RepID=UPI003CD064D7